MTLSRRLLTAIAVLALAITPAVAYAHGKHRGHGHAKVHKADDSRAPIGKVATFTNGVLTVTLGDGSTIAGKVGDRTVLKCETAAPQQSSTTATIRRQDHGNGDDNGGGKGRDDNGDDDAPQASTSTPASTTTPPSNDDNGNHEGDVVGNGRCGTDALTGDSVVRTAKISLTSTGAIWKKVVLLK